METPKDETQKDDFPPPAQDQDEREDAEEEPQPDPPANPPAKSKGAPPGDEDSYEDGWYQVLKRRAAGTGDQEE